MNVVDLRSCLEDWPFDAEKNVRVGRGLDGREIILVRQPMGLEQYEADGRPDGRQVHGQETVLQFFHARINAAKETRPNLGFELTTNDCAELFHEASAFYHRLIVLSRLNDWRRVERDAAQILGLLDFVRQHARCEEDRLQLDPWRPHITRIRVLARAMILLAQGQYQDVLQTARDTFGIVESFHSSGLDHRRLEEFLLESVRGSLATLSAFPPVHSHGESSFIRHEDYWAIRYQGHSAFLKSTRGLQFLAFLLHTPGREFHVSELLSSMAVHPAMTSGLIGDGRRYTGLYEGLPILDAQAKAECKRRLNELRQELDEAERFNDPARAAKANNEMTLFAQHLAAAIGLGGRGRKKSSEAERARCAVTKRIKEAIQKISESIPALGHHLNARIKTGYFCSYNPHPDRPVAWKF